MSIPESLRSIASMSPVIALWFGHCLSAQMDGLNVRLPNCGLVGFDVSDFCWCGEFHREAIDR